MTPKLPTSREERKGVVMRTAGASIGRRVDKVLRPETWLKATNVACKATATPVNAYVPLPVGPFTLAGGEARPPAARYYGKEMNFGAFIGWSIILGLTLLVLALISRAVRKRWGRKTAALSFILALPVIFIAVAAAVIFSALFLSIITGNFAP